MVTESQFLAGLTGGQNDFALAVAALRASGQPFCLIGGLAVNHYAEPMVTLDADFAVAAAPGVAEALRAAGFTVIEHPHSLNATFPGSRLRLQITINSRYGAFPSRAVPGRVFEVDMPVAALPDLVQGKLWAMQDESRRASKRAKDRADLIRLCEQNPVALDYIPSGAIPEVDPLRTPRQE
jgi:hypothetical protein